MQTDASVPAPLWRRALAALYDLLPLAGLLMIANSLAVVLAALATGRRDTDAVLAHGWPLFAQQVWLGGLMLGYYVISWRRGGQTIGMRAWRIALRSDRGSLSLGAALLRALVALFVPGLLWCLVDREQRALHDLAAGTRVVHLPRR